MSQLNLYQLQAVHLIATAILLRGKEGRFDMFMAARTSQFCSPTPLRPSGMGDLAGYKIPKRARKTNAAAFKLSRSQKLLTGNGNSLNKALGWLQNHCWYNSDLPAFWNLGVFLAQGQNGVCFFLLIRNSNLVFYLFCMSNTYLVWDFMISASYNCKYLSCNS